MLVLDGHESHTNADFDNDRSKANEIVPVCLLPLSSHFIYPLDIGVFGLVKKACGDQVPILARANVAYITKKDIFPAFWAAFGTVFTDRNVKDGFRRADLILFNPVAVVSKLAVKLQSPMPPGTSDGLPQPWVS